MTIAATLTAVQYTGNGSATQFSFNNKIFQASDLVVTLFDLNGAQYNFPSQINTGLGLSYTVQNVDVDTGCLVVFNNPPTLGWAIDIRTNTPELQSTSIKNQGAFLPELHEEAFDKITRAVQDNQRQAYTFGIHGPDTEAIPWAALPGPLRRKGMALMFDPITGLPTLGVPNTQTITTGLLAPFLGLAQTNAELAAAVTPANLAYSPGNPWRYGADGLGGAKDVTALATAKTILGTTGVNAWLNGAPIGGFLRTAAEVTAGVLPTDYSRSTEPYDIRRYGAKLDGVTDDTAAWTTALLVASQSVNGSQGSAVSVPQGVSIVSSMIFLPNRVRVLGVDKRGSYVKAAAGWAVGNGSAAWSSSTNYLTGNLVTNGGVLYIAKQASLNQTPPNATFWNPISNAMFYAQNGYSAGIGLSMFDSTLENMSVDANNIAGLGCVLSSAWQEGCGLRATLLLNFGTYGIRFQDGFGGAALCKVVDSEIFGGTITGALGIDLTSPIGIANAFMLDVSNTSIAGGNLTAGVSINSNSACCRSVHFESATSGMLVDVGGFISLQDLTSAGTVTSLVTAAATFAGTLLMTDCRRTGATNFVNDLRAGGYGAITGTDHPLFVINANGTGETAKGAPFASAWCVFNGTTTGTNPPIAGFNVLNVNRTAAGTYTINLRRPMVSSNAAVVASCNLTGSGAQIATQLTGTTSFNVVVGVSGTATDSNEVKAIVFGG